LLKKKNRKRRNMSSKITILGAGPGGYIAAIRAAQLGAQVTVVEREGIGGTCLNWGCIPTKTLKTTAELMESFRRAKELGIEVVGEVRPDMKRLMARKQEVIQTLAEGIFKVFKSYKIQYIKGEGYVSEPTRVRVKQTDNSTIEVVSDKLILATGSRPMSLPNLPIDGQKILSSNDALTLHEVPESILIVGGGVIGCEFAFILASLGSQVTVVEALSRLIPLPSIDKDCSTTIQREMKKRKIKPILKRTVERVENINGKVRVTLGPSPFLKDLKEKEKKPLILEVDKVLVSVGRKPNTREMGLEQLGLEMDDHGWIISNKRMETNLPNVYAIGDVLGPSKMMLAHVASHEGLVSVENAMGGNRKMNYEVVPVGVFTTPEVADVGLTEEQALERGHDARTDSFLFRSLGKSQVIGEIAGEVKIISDIKTKKILGVHIVGPHATDLIAEGTLAMQMGATVEDLASTIHMHPTLSEAMMEASHKALDAGIHYPKEG
jgi:dihydrolipoamide dehydrogenase